MKKTNRILMTAALLAALVFAGQALAAGQLSTVTVSENGSVFVNTGSPSEFRSFWTGQAGSFKLMVDLPGVTVPKTAKLLGNVSSAHGLKGIRFSQFKTEPPVARLVIEAAERLSYTWSTTPEGVEIRFNLPMRAPATADASTPEESSTDANAPGKGFIPPSAKSARQMTETGVPGASKTGTDSGTQSKVTSTGLTTNAPLPTGGIRVGSATPAPKPAADSKTTAATSKGKVSTSTASTPAAQSTGGKPAETSKISAPTTGMVIAPKTETPATAPATSGTSTATAAPSATSTGPKTPKSVAKVTVPSNTVSNGTDTTAPAVKKTDSVSTVAKAPAPASTGTPAAVPNPASTSSVLGKTGTAVTPKSTTPTASGPASGPTTASMPASGTSGTAVKPSSPAPTPSQTAPMMGPMPVSGPTATAPGTAKPSTPSGTATTPPASGTTTGKTVTPSTPAKTGTTTAAPASTTAGKPATGTMTPASTAKPAETGKGAAATTVPPVKGTAAPTTAAKPESAQTVDPDKFKEELKKALGKIEQPAKPEDSKTSTAGKTEGVPVEKLNENSFQEQLKKALDPAASLADTGEAADIDDIDTELPADDENAYDTTFAFPGGTFMQVSPSRKVIRYHSEGRRDPFSPLVGKDRYSGSKKRRAVPSAEQLRLVGIMRSLAGNKALLEDGDGNGYILSPGDRVRNGYLVSVSESKVLFQVTEYGWTKTVAMELANLE